MYVYIDMNIVFVYIRNVCVYSYISVHAVHIISEYFYMSITQFFADEYEMNIIFLIYRNGSYVRFCLVSS